MRVCPSVNQLYAYFQYMRHAELLRDLAQVALHNILVLHHACATDYLEVGDFSEVRKDFILDTIGEKSVLLICAQIFEWEYGDRFFRNCRRLRYRFGLPRQHSEVQGSKEENGER